jgi:hypothetical protein
VYARSADCRRRRGLPQPECGDHRAIPAALNAGGVRTARSDRILWRADQEIAML